MATKAANTEEPKKLSAWDKLVNAIMGIKAEEEASTKADDEEEMSTEQPAGDAETKKDEGMDDDKKSDDDSDASKKGNDPDDDNDDDSDPDKDNDDDSDEDEIEVNGKKFNFKKPDQAKSALVEFTKVSNETINSLKQEVENLKADVAAKDQKLSKKDDDIKKEIKSTFVPPSSKRSARIGAGEERESVPDFLMAKPGTLTETAIQNALSAKKAEEAARGR